MDLNRITFSGIGTTWVVDYFPNEENDTIPNSITKLVNEFEEIYSRFKPDSFINRVGYTVGTHLVNNEFKQLFELYLTLYELTKGKFTPLIGSLLEDAGYDKEYSLTPKTLRTVTLIADALSYCYPKIVIKKPVQFDFGAAGKGFLIDKVAKFLDSQNITDYIIDAGRDFKFKQTSPIKNRPYRVGLEHPNDVTSAIGVAELNTGSLCCSSGSSRKWKNFHHIFDPHLKKSPENVIATWVYADIAFIADALSTCLFFVNPTTLEDQFDFEYVVMYADSTFDISKNFPGGLFTS